MIEAFSRADWSRNSWVESANEAGCGFPLQSLPYCIVAGPRGSGRAGVGITEAVNGRCSRCNIVLRPQFYQDLKKGEAIMTCESCGRILYYNPVQNPVQAMDDHAGRRVNMSGDNSRATLESDTATKIETATAVAATPEK